jgi:nucleotide-binding universal stress UspA family protein
LQLEVGMTTQGHTPTRTATPGPSQPAVAAAKLCVVVGLDFTEADGPAFDKAARVAMRVPGSELHLVHVFDTAPSAERTRDLVAHLRLYVDEKAAITQGLRGIVVGIHVRGGKPVRELIQLATEVGADFIVVGSHPGLHVRDWVIGSTVKRLVNAASFPVLVASPPPKEPVEHEPVIEPPCPQCVQARSASGGKQWWCERHSHTARRDHTYSYQSELPMSSHDSAISPTGIDF